MNHLENLPTLKNRYFLMRHGQSKANIKGIIISDPENGILEDHALSDVGRKQARDSVAKSRLSKDVIIYCSDFSRARETAQIVQEVLGAKPVTITHSLRERHFGNWETSDHSNYQKVWDDDAADAAHTNNNVEAVWAVLDRATKFILELEKKYNNQEILLVSHGDTLQILQTGFQKSDPAKHRSLIHLETAEIREVVLH